MEGTDLDQIIEALNLWIQITGVDPESSSIRSSEWDIFRYNEELQASLIIDKSKITTMMMLDHYVRQYLSERVFTVQSILDDFDSVVNYLGQCRQLLAILNSKSVTTAREEFISSLKKALSHYEVNDPSVLQTVENKKEIAFLRRDALRSIERLSVHQFLQGDPDNVQPSYYKTIHEFWNINTLLESACKMKSGISLNFIRDPKVESSYFAFAIRNGGTITILTDKEIKDTPIQRHGYRPRSEARELNKRIVGHHFPYNLLNVQFDEDERAYIPREKVTSLVVHRSRAVPLMEIKDLSAQQTIWTIMMFGLINERFFKQNFKTKELSYTGEMIRYSDSLIQGAAQLAVRNYQPLLAKPLTIEDVTSQNFSPYLKRKSKGKHQWIEQRYGSKAKDRYLNLLTGHDNRPKFLLSLDHMKNYEREIIKSMDVTPSELEGIHFLDFESKSRIRPDNEQLRRYAVELQTLKATNFGSAEELLYDQRYIARYNYVMMLQIELNREYEERKDEILTWFEEQVYSNKKVLSLTAASGSSEQMKVETLNLKADTWRKLYSNHLRLYTPDHKDRFNYRCIETGGKASVAVIFHPNEPKDLAYLCGCEVDELPDLLQHWERNENSDDPLDWAIKNPWRRHDFDVVVYLSRTAYNQLRKSSGLPPNKFWAEEDRKKITTKAYLVKPGVGAEVRFGTWTHLDTSEAPSGPWQGVITEVVKEGRVNGLYRIRRHHDGKIQEIRGYQNLYPPE